jgi:hypothetical protein
MNLPILQLRNVTKKVGSKRHYGATHPEYKEESYESNCSH